MTQPGQARKLEHRSRVACLLHRITVEVKRNALDKEESPVGLCFYMLVSSKQV